MMNNEINKNEINKINRYTKDENPLGIFIVYHFLLKNILIPTLSIVIYILLIGTIIIFSIEFINSILGYFFKISSEEALAYSIILTLIITVIITYFILNKMLKKIFNYLKSDNKKTIENLKKISYTSYAILNLFIYAFKNIILIIAIIILSLHILSLLIHLSILIIILPIATLILIKLVYNLLKTPLLVIKILRESIANPLLIEYINFKINQQKYIEEMIEDNESIEILIKLIKENKNYIYTNIENYTLEEIINSLDKIVKKISGNPLYYNYVVCELQSGKNIVETGESIVKIEEKLTTPIKEDDDYIYI